MFETELQGARQEAKPAIRAIRRSVARKPDLYLVCVMLLTLTSVWRLQQTVPILAVLQLPSLAAIGSYALFALSTDKQRKIRTIRHPITYAVLALLVTIAISVVAGEYPGASFSFLRKDYIKTFVMFALVASSIRSMRDFEFMLGAQVAGAALYGLVVLSRFSVEESSGRLGDLLYYDSNDLAMILAMTLPLAVYFLRPGTKLQWRLVALGTFAIILVAIVKTGSRGGFLGILTVLTFLLLRFNAIPARVRFGAVAAFVIGLLLVSNDRYWEMMGTLLNPTEDYNFAGNSSGGRVEIWKRGFGYAATHPLFGVGASNFGYAESNLGRAALRAQAGFGTQALAPHNSFVMAMAELGFVGLFVFVWLLFVAMRSLSRSIARARQKDSREPREAALGQALWAAMLAYFVSGFFLSQTYSSLLHVLLALIVALQKLQQMRGLDVSTVGSRPARIGRTPPLPQNAQHAR
jgi:O-antigen ligase